MPFCVRVLSISVTCLLYNTHMAMTRLPKRVALNVTEQEFQALEAFADKDGRTKTEIIREFIRSLSTYKPATQTTDKTDT